MNIHKGKDSKQILLFHLKTFDFDLFSHHSNLLLYGVFINFLSMSQYSFIVSQYSWA